MIKTDRSILLFLTINCLLVQFAPISSNVCQTDICLAKAADIKSSLNESLNPCDDFYAYTCGNYTATHSPPAFYFLEAISATVAKTKQDLLRSTASTNCTAEITARKLFAQCVDDKLTEELGTKPLLNTLDNLIGGWPMIMTNWTTNATLKSIFVSAYYSQLPMLVKISVELSMLNTSQYWIELDEPTEFYSRDVLESERGEKLTQEYIEWVAQMATMLVNSTNSPVNTSAVQFTKDITSIVDFGRTIIMAKKTAVEDQDMKDKTAVTTLGALQRNRKFQSVLLSNLTDLIRTIFERANKSHLITDDTPVVDMSPNYLMKVDERLRELENAGIEGKRRLANYIGWKVIVGSRNWLPKEYRGKSKFTSADMNAKCAQYVTEVMPLLVDEIYAERVNASNVIAKATPFAKNIQSSLSDLITESTWLDNVTRQYALEKLQNIQIVIGYTSTPETKKKIDSLYQNITVRSNFYETVQSIKEFESLQNLAKLDTVFQRNDTVWDTTRVNAFYETVTSTMVIPLAILQQPIFHPDFPDAINYGDTGFTVGHEFTHAFDTRGAQFGKLGGIVSWWTNETWSMYKTRAQSLVDQYNRYSLDVGSVNGQLTLIENIADNGGLKVAFKAFRKLLRLTTSTGSLPGLEKFTPEQLFFVGVSTAWCETRSKNDYRLKLLTSTHGIPKFRINGAMSNMPEFAEAFNCTIGSPMNPKKKNGVW